jgi:hypothetical protein
MWGTHRDVVILSNNQRECIHNSLAGCEEEAAAVMAAVTWMVGRKLSSGSVSH